MGLYRIYPIQHFCVGSFYSQGKSTHTAPNVWGENMSADCSANLNESIEALNETNAGFIRSSTLGYNPGRFEHTYGAPPSGLVITKIRIVAYLRTSSGNNTAMDERPRMKGFVNPAGTRYYYTYFIVTTGGPVNRASGGPYGTYVKYTAGEWTVNPATGVAWTMGDLASGVFKAGIECGGIAEGQAANGCPSTTGGNCGSLDAALICVEIEGVPADLATEPIRAVLSRLLWLKRRRMRPISLALTLPNTDLEPGQTVYLDDPHFPTGEGEGVTRRDWDARPLFVVSKAERPGGDASTITAWDQRELAIALWSPLHTDIGADDIWTGIAWLDTGGGKTVTRAQDGWIWRPNDFYLRDAIAGKWRITPWGLAIGGGSYAGYSANAGELTHYPTYNTFSAGTGGEGTSLPDGNTTGFSGWTVELQGAGTCVVKQDSSYLFDVSGYRRAARLAMGADWTTSNAELTQSVAGFAPTDKIRVHLKFRMVAGNNVNLRFGLGRTTAPLYWSNLAAAWGATQHTSIADDLARGAGSLAVIGNHCEYWSREITVGGTGAQTLTLYVGQVGQNNGQVDMFAAEIVSTGAATGVEQKVLRRDFLATGASSLVQAADVIDLDNQEAYRVWDASRGTWSLMVTPLWDHEDLADGAVKCLVCANHQGTANDREYLRYTRTNATAGAWQFIRVVAGVLTMAIWATSSAAGTLPRYWTPVRISIRWTSASGEFGLPTRTLSIFVNGVKGTDAQAAGQSTQLNVGAYVGLGRNAPGAAGSVGGADTFADGLVAYLHAHLFCLTDAEIARLHSQMSLGNALPSLIGV